MNLQYCWSLNTYGKWNVAGYDSGDLGIAGRDFEKSDCGFREDGVPVLKAEKIMADIFMEPSAGQDKISSTLTCIPDGH
jgi:hypothetical protein